VAPGNVNNAQAAMPQPDSTINVHAVVIRPAVAQSLVHGVNFASGDHPGLIEFENPTNSTHILLFTFTSHAENEEKQLT